MFYAIVVVCWTALTCLIISNQVHCLYNPLATYKKQENYLKQIQKYIPSEMLRFIVLVMLFLLDAFYVYTSCIVVISVFK